jgi:heme/copper-type cytochrome/quinol oxidase subunit 4
VTELTPEKRSTEITIIVVLIALLLLLPPFLHLWTAQDNAWFTPYLVWLGVIVMSYLLQKKLN